MSRQIPLDLPLSVSHEEGDYFVSEANRAAHGLVLAPARWPEGRLVLVGPAGAGKSHLAAAFAQATGARALGAAALEGADLAGLATGPLVIEGADALAGSQVGERALFHLLNLMAEARQPSLFTAAAAPAHWPVALPDLASRLKATAVARLDPPDEALMAAVLVKLFADRQLAVPPNVVQYLVPRLERSLAEAERIVARIDREALARGRPVTRELVRQVIGGAQQGLPGID